MEHLPNDEVRKIRDSIAQAEAELTAALWERHRDLHGRIEELKAKCEQAGHSLMIVLAGKVGPRRRLLRRGWSERRTCILCGTEEIGKLATGFVKRFLVRQAVWKFEKLTGQHRKQLWLSARKATGGAKRFPCHVIYVDDGT
jgi:hypothetical protein